MDPDERDEVTLVVEDHQIQKTDDHYHLPLTEVHTGEVAVTEAETEDQP